MYYGGVFCFEKRMTSEIMQKMEYCGKFLLLLCWNIFIK